MSSDHDPGTKFFRDGVDVDARQEFINSLKDWNARVAKAHISELVTVRNQLNSEIDRRTAETENTPGAMTIVRDFANWHAWYESAGFDDESREELDRIVRAAAKLLSSADSSHLEK